MSSIKNNKRNLTLNDLSRRKVVEHNDLISSVAKMDKVPLKIFELAVSCIDTDNPPKDNTVYLSKTELFTFFDVQDNDRHSRFKQAIEKMQKQAFFEIEQLKDNQKDFEMMSIVPIPTVRWNSYNEEVAIEFNRNIMPYLIDLRTNFTQYAISDIMELNSKYSIILYKWLCMYYNQYEHYSNKGGRRNEQIEAYSNPSISIQDLRSLTDTIDEYQRFTNFSKKVLDTPLEEINAHTHFNVKYDKIKKGRYIDSIQFHITKKLSAKDENYKQEQQDQTYLYTQKEREITQQAQFTVAMQSPYTKLLSEKWLINLVDMQNISTMTGLQEKVFPLYDELKKARGIKEVEKHLSYVSSKQEGYSKRNVVKYLKKSIEGYLAIVTLQDVEYAENSSYNIPKTKALKEDQN